MGLFVHQVPQEYLSLFLSRVTDVGAVICRYIPLSDEAIISVYVKCPAYKNDYLRGYLAGMNEKAGMQ